MLIFLKKWLGRHNFYYQSPVILRKPLREGKVVVFRSRDLEIDREKIKAQEEAEKNPPHPVN